MKKSEEYRNAVGLFFEEHPEVVVEYLLFERATTNRIFFSTKLHITNTVYVCPWVFVRKKNLSVELWSPFHDEIIPSEVFFSSLDDFKMP